MQYGKVKPDTALRNAREHLGDRSVESEWARIDDDVERRITGAAQDIGRLAYLARFHMLLAHAGRTSAANLTQVDWHTWRTGLELRLLDHRSTLASRRAWDLSFHAALSSHLQLAFGLALTGRAAMVPPLLRDMAKALPKVLDWMNTGRKPSPVRFGILGLFLDQYGSPVQHASLSPVPADVPEAIAQRITYSTSKGAQGNLLPAPEGDLVPLELIWFNTTLTDAARDPQLTVMAEAIAATRYPEDNPRFVDLDTRLTVEGY